MKCLGLNGLVAAPHTPMTAEGAVHLPAIEQQAQLRYWSSGLPAPRKAARSGTEKQRCAKQWSVSSCDSSESILLSEMNRTYKFVAAIRKLLSRCSEALLCPDDGIFSSSTSPL